MFHLQFVVSPATFNPQFIWDFTGIPEISMSLTHCLRTFCCAVAHGY